MKDILEREPSWLGISIALRILRPLSPLLPLLPLITSTFVGSAAWTFTITTCGEGGPVGIVVAQLAKKMKEMVASKIFFSMIKSPFLIFSFFVNPYFRKCGSSFVFCNDLLSCPHGGLT
jgi:hypothetical protein